MREKFFMIIGLDHKITSTRYETLEEATKDAMDLCHKQGQPFIILVSHRVIQSKQVPFEIREPRIVNITPRGSL